MSQSEANSRKLTQTVDAGRDVHIAGRDLTTSKTFNVLVPIFIIGSLLVLGGLALSLINPGEINQPLPQPSQTES